MVKSHTTDETPNNKVFKLEFLTWTHLGPTPLPDPTPNLITLCWQWRWHGNGVYVRYRNGRWRAGNVSKQLVQKKKIIWSLQSSNAKHIDAFWRSKKYCGMEIILHDFRQISLINMYCLRNMKGIGVKSLISSWKLHLDVSLLILSTMDTKHPCLC